MFPDCPAKGQPYLVLWNLLSQPSKTHRAKHPTKTSKSSPRCPIPAVHMYSTSSTAAGGGSFKNRKTIGWKNTAFRDFSNIWRGCIFFHLTFVLLHLLSADLTTLLLWSSFCWLDYYCSFHLLFNSPYCRKFLFKLPSIINIFISMSHCNFLLHLLFFLLHFSESFFQLP